MTSLLLSTSRRFTLALLAAVVLGGCSTGRHAAPPADARCVVAVARAPFYKNGPAQGSEPDLYLERDQIVTVQARQLGYSHVLTADGVEGYVAASKLRPAPPVPPTPAPAPRALPSPPVEPDLPGLNFSDLPPSPEKSPAPPTGGARLPNQ
jgi:hypothetical protein